MRTTKPILYGDFELQESIRYVQPIEVKTGREKRREKRKKERKRLG